jgi:hypothetical protein
MRRFCTIEHYIYHFLHKRCNFSSIYQIILLFICKKFSFCRFYVFEKTFKCHISTDYAISYSHSPQVFPQVSIVQLPLEISTSPHFPAFANFEDTVTNGACITHCIFIQNLNFILHDGKKCRSISMLLHFKFIRLLPESIW